ncbi:hypothetical protein LSUB1_G007603 [Lachnellula subtilissima]|uniref:FAD dependent oxidoreductase domain-containing protein n=1 Tax=Lachnellula subtilissima TaxID=602034 RepID=A0A8H8RED5_9HELO|nr:hypothetical protein LSUB1_G007603 [Lachnellula subtilissima]
MPLKAIQAYAFTRRTGSQSDSRLAIQQNPTGKPTTPNRRPSNNTKFPIYLPVCYHRIRNHRRKYCLELLAKEPHAQTLVLKACQASSGDTGRNGGHCRACRYTSLASDLRNFGEEEALRLDKLKEENVASVGKLIKELRIKCDLREVETVDIWTDQDEWDDVLELLKQRHEVLDGKMGEGDLKKYKIWTRDEARKELLVPEAVGAVSIPAYASNPYKFVCGLLEVLLKKGINLQTNTPVVEVNQTNSGHGTAKWILHTLERGQVLADKFILATNAYTATLYPPLADFMIPTISQIAAVRPGSNIAGNPALKRTCGMSKGDYMQSRAGGFSGAGDIIIGYLHTTCQMIMVEDLEATENSLFWMAQPSIPTSLNFSCLQLPSILDEKIRERTAKQYKNRLIRGPLLEKLRVKTDFGSVLDSMATSAEALVQLVTGNEKEVDA